MKLFLDWRCEFRSGWSPFELGRRQRPLRVFYDRETFVPSMATTLLDELRSAPDVEVESTMMNGELSVEVKEHSDGLVVAFREHDRFSRTFVDHLSTWTHFAHARFDADSDLPDGPWKEPDYRLRRLIFMQVANLHRADLFITDDRFLLEANDIEFHGTNAVSTREGIAILGAHLRNRKNFVIRSSPDGRYTDSLVGNSFYTGCRRAIQDSTPMLSVRFIDPEMKRTVGRAFSAIAARTEQLLRARDSAIFALLQPHGSYAVDDALFALDMFMLVLGSIFDSLAQMTDAVLSIESKAQHADWCSDRWIKALRAKDQGLASIVAPGTRYRFLLQFHALLRNSIHGGINQRAILTDNALPPEGLLVIPESEHRLVRRAIRVLGGPQRFGAAGLHGELWLRPGSVIEAFLDEGMAFVSRVYLELARRLPASDPARIQSENMDDDADQRCAYLAGITELTTFQYRDI